MLKGRASLIRLVGKRRRLSDPSLLEGSSLSDPADQLFGRWKTRRKGNAESSSYSEDTYPVPTGEPCKLENDGEHMDQHKLDWVSCPVCGKRIRDTHGIINSHLDLCLSIRTPRKLTQSTLFQFNFNIGSDNQSCCKDFNHSRNADRETCEETKSRILDPSSSFGDIGNSDVAIDWDHDLSGTSDSRDVSSPEDVGTEGSINCNKVVAVTPLIFQDTNVSRHKLVKDDHEPLEALETHIVGRSFCDEVVLKLGASISFLRDPDNVKDHYAIKVFYSNQMVGFLPRELAKYLSPLIDGSYLKLEGFVSSLPKNASDVVPIKILCQKLQCENGSHDHQYFMSLWTNALGVVEATRTLGPNVKKYQLNFHILLQEVMKHHSYLFTDDERSFLDRFEALSEDSQRLFIRLYTRKGPWFRMSNVSYPEISDVQSAVVELFENGYMYSWDPSKMITICMLREVLNVLTVQELRKISRLAYLKKNGGVVRRGQMCDSLTASYADGTCPMLPRLISDKIGVCASVSYLADNLLWRIQRLFFLNGEQDLSSFLLIDLGLVRYPSYAINISHNIFSARSDLLAYEEAIKVAQVMDESLDENDMEMVSQCIESSERYLSSQAGMSDLSCHEPVGAFLYQLSAAWVYSKVLALGVSVLEHERRYEEAIRILKHLLSAIACGGKRGYWALRLSVDLEHLGRLDESLLVAEESLADSWVRAGSRIALQRRILRLGRPPRRWKVPDFAKLFKRKISEVHVQGRPLDNNQGIKSIFYGDDGEQCGVEELALQYYAGAGGWQGVHSESGIWMTLFGLLMWDAIFANVPDVFRTKFQTAPLDLECDSFYPVRRGLIESQLQKIDQGMAVSILTSSWNAHVGTTCMGVKWDLLPLSDLQLVVSCIEGSTLASLCHMLAQDYRSWSSGMPDLLLWRCYEDGNGSKDVLHSGCSKTSGKTKLVEVKGPNDRLSEQQHAWLLALMDCGFVVEVCKVRPMSMDE